MAKYRDTIASPTAAINWIDMFASGQALNGVTSGHFFVRTNVASRIEVGAADPVASASAGIATVAGESTEVVLGAEAASQTLWVQSPADQSDVFIEIDDAGGSPVVAVFA